MLVVILLLFFFVSLTRGRYTPRLTDWRCKGIRRRTVNSI